MALFISNSTDEWNVRISMNKANFPLGNYIFLIDIIIDYVLLSAMKKSL